MKVLTTIATTLLLLGAFPASYAQVVGKQAAEPQVSQAMPAPDPREIIQQGAQRMQDFLTSNDLTDSEQIKTFLETEVTPLFDFGIMSQLVLGHLNPHVNQQQRAAVTTMIKKSFLAALVNNLSNYRGGKIDYMNINGNLANGKVSVRLAASAPDLYPTVIELRIVLTSQGWKIIDVAANGRSAIAHYRNTVYSTVQRSGLDGLLLK